MLTMLNLKMKHYNKIKYFHQKKFNNKGFIKTKFINKKCVIKAYNNKVIDHLSASLYILNIFVDVLSLSTIKHT
jgi:hypothetical protein